MDQHAGSGPLVSRLRVRGFKSLADCEVRFERPLTVLVGRNAAGKSNLLEVFDFVRDCVANSPLVAVRDRGGLARLLNHDAAARGEHSIAIELDLRVDSWADANKGKTEVPNDVTTDVDVTWGFELVPGPDRGKPVRVASERMVVHRQDELRIWGFERDKGGRVESSAPHISAREVPAASLWISVGDQIVINYHVRSALESFSSFSPILAEMKTPQEGTGPIISPHRDEYSDDYGEVQPLSTELTPDARNLGEVIEALVQLNPDVKERLDRYLAAIVPGALSVEPVSVNDFHTFNLRMASEETGEIETFAASQLSDGTLRALAVLGALFQPALLEREDGLLCIDEPELGLHPAAAGAVFDALTEASRRTQVIAATQSGDLLHREEIDPESVRVVAMRDGATVIGPIDETSRRIVRDKLATIGELMRGDQLEPRMPGAPG